MPETPAIFNLLPILPFLPLAAFVVIVLWAHRSKKLSAGIAIGGIGLSWLIGWAMVFTTFRLEGFGEHPFRVFRDWLPIGRTWQAFGFALDPLSAAMLFMVPFICLLIFIYAVGYMGVGKPLGLHDERGKPAEPGNVDKLASRFFAYIALFAAGMIGLILADNLILFLIFWELMGLCSYLLIGFWFARTYDDPKKITPKEAGLKAFLTTRIGDTIMLAGIFLLYAQTNSLSFVDIFRPAMLEQLATSTVNLPLLGAVSWATIIAILIFFGAMGKSAQFPLHVWLPDAMEGPTPVSALIHAATMVSAGVYLVIRTYPADAGRRARSGASVHCHHRHLYGALRRVHRGDAERHQEGAGLFHDLAARLHVRGVGHRRLPGRHLPPADPRVLQGAAVPRLRQRDPRDGAWAS